MTDQRGGKRARPPSAGSERSKVVRETHRADANVVNDHRSPGEKIFASQSDALLVENALCVGVCVPEGRPKKMAEIKLILMEMGRPSGTRDTIIPCNIYPPGVPPGHIVTPGPRNDHPSRGSP